jgi:hypothetical protein
VPVNLPYREDWCNTAGFVAQALLPVRFLQLTVRVD